MRTGVSTCSTVSLATSAGLSSLQNLQRQYDRAINLDLPLRQGRSKHDSRCVSQLTAIPPPQQIREKKGSSKPNLILPPSISQQHQASKQKGSFRQKKIPHQAECDSQYPKAAKGHHHQAHPPRPKCLGRTAGNTLTIHTYIHNMHAKSKSLTSPYLKEPFFCSRASCSMAPEKAKRAMHCIASPMRAAGRKVFVFGV